MKNKNIVIGAIAVIGIIATLIAPTLMTRGLSEYDFTTTGQVGDTIGGTTAPIVGLLSIIFLIWTLWEQISFNKKQKDISADDQFKSTFFNLLQVQRDIIDKISGEFSYLGHLVYEEYPKQNNEITIKKENKIFATIENNQNKEDKKISGLEFFKSSRYQLRLIYEALDCVNYYNNYDDKQAFDIEEQLREEYYRTHADDVDDLLNKTREPFRLAYINDKYGILEKIHKKYHELDKDKKIGLGYALFYNKYEPVGYYFRHLYYILKFIKKNEDDKILALGDNTQQVQIEKIRKEYNLYAQFIQAQMSTDELLMTFYNSFAFPRAQELIIHYNLLENLTIQNLIKKEHNCKPEIRLKDRNDSFIALLNNE